MPEFQINRTFRQYCTLISPYKISILCLCSHQAKSYCSNKKNFSHSIFFLLQRSVRSKMIAYGKRNTVYAKWKTNFTFTQTTVFMKLIVSLLFLFLDLTMFAQ